MMAKLPDANHSKAGALYNEGGLLGVAAIKRSLLCGAAALALASAQVSSGWAALPSPAIQTPAANDNSSTAANTSFVGTAIANLQAYIVGLLGGKAPLASPALTGTPTAPTPSAGDSSTAVPTTSFVSTAIANLQATIVTLLGGKLSHV